MNSTNRESNKNDVINISTLFKDLKLNIPDYQRPYCWTDDQVMQLLEDIIEAWKENKRIYLVGNVIFYKDRNNLSKENIINIVDGQQRITTFAIMMYVFKQILGNCSEEKNFDFIEEPIFTPLSKKRLKHNKMLIENRLSRSDIKKSFAQYVCKNVYITCTYAESLDEAFFYFDAQNTRGKPLARKDLLKVHHLRHMLKDTPENVIMDIIKDWEKYEKTPPEDIKYLGEDFLEFLFEQVLGLTRKAVRGELEPDNLAWIDVYREFRSEGGPNLLNNYNQPPLFKFFHYDPQQDVVSFTPKIAPFTGPYMLQNGKRYLPFEVTQSISGGLHFFLYAFKYVEALKQLRNDPWFCLLDDVTGAGNRYLRKVYRAVLLYFFDKFGMQDFEDFAAHLFLLLAYYRNGKASLYKEGVKKFEWNRFDNNIEPKQWDPFKAILLKYASTHVLKDLQSYLLYYCDNKNWHSSLGRTKKEFYYAAKNEPYFKVVNEAMMNIWNENYGESSKQAHN